MAIQREVSLDMNAMGMWTMVAKDCPANKLRAQLGDKPETCRAGLSTNAQGAIPLHKCRFLVGEIEDVDGRPIANCGFEDQRLPVSAEAKP